LEHHGKDSRFNEVELGYQSGSYLSGKSLCQRLANMCCSTNLEPLLFQQAPPLVAQILVCNFMRISFPQLVYW